MLNTDIADTFKLVGQLMELHGENEFKAKAMLNASFKIDKLGFELQEVDDAELEKIEGIGKGLAAKIIELNNTESLQELEKLLDKTPQGVLEMLEVKGIGPKKVAMLWKELGVESIGELLYACNENRLVELKGFGEKTQEAIRINIEYKLANLGKYHFAAVEGLANEFIDLLKVQYPNVKASLTGAILRKCNVIEKIEVLVAATEKPLVRGFDNPNIVPITMHLCSDEDFYFRLFETSSSPEHITKAAIPHKHYSSEREVYEQNNLQFVEPELREGLDEISFSKNKSIPELIEMSDLKGILHVHTKYSDGQHSLADMADYARAKGYQYLGISDHSQTAVYAGGLKYAAVVKQHEEIDQLNQRLAPFKIFKGIESDVLGDGSLDYEEHVLKSFDFIIASVHSNLKMDKEKATTRLLKAIENPYTTMLGHMTGRLLLSREGYPLDHKKIIDACAENKVVIELNAHPYRLDIDWSWLYYCREKGVKISINPDAHSKVGYNDMYFGVFSARKGMLSKDLCFNALDLSEMEAYLGGRK